MRKRFVRSWKYPGRKLSCIRPQQLYDNINRLFLPSVISKTFISKSGIDLAPGEGKSIREEAS